MPQYVFGAYQIDIGERVFTRDGEAIRLRGKVFDTLAHLVINAGKLVRKDDLIRAVWPDAIVEDNNADHCVSQLRKVFGSENFIETVPRQGYRFVAEVRSASETASSAKTSKLPRDAGVPKIPKQEIRFFDSYDGARIAYSVAGSGPPLVKAANWLNHLEFEWKSPIWAHWVAELTSHHTLYRYDERGNGLSDWNIQDFSFPAWVRDFEKLIDTINIEKFALLGISQGASVAISYAVRHPERVSKLILYGAFARGWQLRGSEEEIERRHALLTLVRIGWGKDNPAFRQLWTTLFMPDATPEQADWFNELQRVTTSPENAVQLLYEGGKINVVDLLPKVQCPTIVFHSRNEAAVPFAEGRLMATRIPGAKFVELPSRNHLVIPQEPAWGVFVRELGKFMEWDEAEEHTARAVVSR